jgi:triphosphoribosyl-dephospho-CoA synthetase
VNLAAKTVLCEKAEEIAAREVAESNTWNEYSKELEGLQKEWKSIGFASKKDNQKIYDRFRAACDQFYNRKREYYSQFKDQMTRNMEQKIALCEQAEAMKESTDWKKTTEDLINLQKQWKEIGPVSRKKSDQIWNRFRSACDYFFDNKEKNYGGVDPQYVENLNKKLAIIEEIKAYEPEDRASDAEAMKEFMNRWNEIGFVPFKEKEKVQAMFKEALNSKFHGVSRSRRGGGKPQKETNPLRTEREKLVQKFRKKESEIATYENNIGFFASSKNADALVKELSKKIEAAKAELAELEEKIKEIDNQFE